MSRLPKIILFLVVIIIFFEIGLFASYSIISAEPVNPSELISMQLDGISNVISSTGGNTTLKDQQTCNITNDNDVALILQNQSNLSVNLNSVTAKLSSDNTGNQTVTITAVATEDTQSTSGGAVIITPKQTYSITASAMGEVYSSSKVKINTTSIKIKEKIVLYNQTGNQNNNSTNLSDINSMVDYFKNTTNNTTSNNTTATNVTKNTSKSKN